MKTFVKTIIAMVAIIIFGLALAQNTEAAPNTQRMSAISTITIHTF